MTAPALRFVFRGEVTIGPPVDHGAVAGGRRRFIPITGGIFDGADFKATVLPGGGDWQTIAPDGTIDLEARYAVQAEDGTVIRVTNQGYRRATPQVQRKLEAGEAVDPSDYYFRTRPRFDCAADGAHGWLASTIFICDAGRKADRVLLDFYAVD